MSAGSHSRYHARLGLRSEVLSGTVLLHTRAIGVNYANVYRRWGNYHLMDQSPCILDCEAAGEVVAVGAGVTGAHVGQCIAVADVPHAEFMLVPQEHLLPLPDDGTFEWAAAVLPQGLAVQYLKQSGGDPVPVDPNYLMNTSKS